MVKALSLRLKSTEFYPRETLGGVLITTNSIGFLIDVPQRRRNLIDNSKDIKKCTFAYAQAHIISLMITFY